VLAWLADPTSPPLRFLHLELSPTKLSTARVAFGLPQEWITTFEVGLTLDDCSSVVYFGMLDSQELRAGWPHVLPPLRVT
jgi:hypothetical protein